MDLQTIKTPGLLLDFQRARHNAEQMAKRVKEFNVNLRPHVKTHKCVEVARLQTVGHSGGITVSTLAEARAFAAAGFPDILYAVPIEPGKFVEACEIAKDCEYLALITDDADVPLALNETARRSGVKLDLFLKVDTGYHRCGVDPDSEAAFEIPRRITECSNLRFAGILTHAGHSYHARSSAELLDIARQERDLMKSFGEQLNSKSLEVPNISIGSTPTLSCIDHLDGITEARPGNYVFFDAFQATLGSCTFEDCALTVLAAVIHRDAVRQKIIVDAGAIALSKDRGPVEFDPDCGFGRVLDLQGKDLGLRIDSLSQEHGVIRVGNSDVFNQMRIGERVRILANHSCLTAAQYSFYHVLEGERIIDRWERINGW